MSFPDRKTLFELGFGDLVARLDELRIADLVLVGPDDRGTFHDWLLLVERFPERLVQASHELTEDELLHSFELVESILQGAEIHGGHSRGDVLNARFNLSVSLIGRLSPLPGVPLLDPDELLRDYLAALPVTLAEATEMTRRVDTLDDAEILRLREPKTLMIPLKMVDHLFRDSPELDEYRAWKAIWADLP